MPMDDWKPIKLSAKVFGHISQGLYRTPAGAIKELISNSFDADARVIKIHTGFPYFDTFSCEDDGRGISLDEFQRLMERGIGTSYKRILEDAVTQIYNRPIIGRLGIGILSLAQICTQFDIISHHPESKGAFKASIQFPPYTKREIDKILQKKEEAEKEELLIQGGKYRLEKISYLPEKAGVRIFTKFLRESFRKRMKNLSSYGNKVIADKSEPYKSFEKFMNAVYGIKQKTKSLNLLSDYDQLIFGLALAAPLPYFEGGQGNIALKMPFLQDYQKTLTNYKFDVEVDNLTLARPIYLPSDREGRIAQDCKVGNPGAKEFILKDGPHKEKIKVTQYPINVESADEQFSLYELSYSNMNVSGRPLAFSGYLFQQTGRLYPRDIQGILIRLRNVAIGSYDADIMTYPYAEGPRYSMVSLELFVENGFEDALNIDRDSFNGLDPHYIRTQAFVHSLLHGVIFPETWTEEKARNKQRRQKIASAREASFIKALSKATRENYARIERTEPKQKAAIRHPELPPVHFDRKAKIIEIDKSHPSVQNIFRRKKHAQLAEQILIAFERANREPNEARRREVFYKLLGDIFLKM
jgi:hypothetical protein